MEFEIAFTGHQNIRSLHKNTLEITRDSTLTPRGDCIIGVNARYGCKQIPDALKMILRDSNTVVKFTITVKDKVFSFIARGDSSLSLDDQNDIVIRKSSFVCPRTLAVSCNKASSDIPREIVQMLQDPSTVGTLLIEV